MRRWPPAIAWLLVGLAGTASPAGAGELLLAGSRTVQERILMPCASAIERSTGIRMRVLGVGTGGGFQKLRAGEVSAAIASSPLSMLLSASGLPDDGVFQEHVVLEDTVVAIVHRDNQVTDLSWEWLSAIHRGEVTNWSELGGPDLHIQVIAPPPGSASWILFNTEVLGGAGCGAGVIRAKSAREQIDLVSRFKGGIGMISLGVVRLRPGWVRVVRTRPIAQPLGFITRGEPSEKVRRLIDFLRTDRAGKMFR